MFLVRLRAHALTPCVTVVAQLVEYVLELIFAVAVGREKSEVEHRSEAHVVVVLVVNRVAQIVRLVLLGVIYTEEVVVHILILAVLVGVVERGNHTHLSVAQLPAAS